MAFTLDAFGETLAGVVAEGPSRRFVVALSGGLDSTVALSALLASSVPTSVRAIHVDHGLHPDSAEWRRHCRDVCADLNVPFSDAAISDPMVRDWVDMHAAPGFTAQAAWLRDRLDALGADMTKAERDATVRLFGRVQQLEIDFHSAAYADSSISAA